MDKAIVAAGKAIWRGLREAWKWIIAAGRWVRDKIKEVKA